MDRSNTEFPLTELIYVITPEYDLSMSLVIASQTNNGILLSGDKRGTGVFKDTGKPIESNKLKKIFNRERFAWGMAGHNVENPAVMDRYFDQHLDIKDSDSLEEIIQSMLDLSLDYHNNIQRYDTDSLQLLVVGYEGYSPVIHKMTYIKDGSAAYLNRNEKFAAIGVTKLAYERFGNLPRLSQDTTLSEHASLFESVAKDNKGVSDIFDSYLVGSQGIIAIN